MLADRTQWRGRIILILLFSLHAAGTGLFGRPDAAQPLGALWGTLHLVVALSGLVLFGDRLAGMLLGRSAERAEKWLATAILALAAWFLLGQALGLVGALRFVPAAIAVDALAIIGLLFRRAETAAEGRARVWPGLILALVLLRFAAPWGSGLSQWFFSVFEDPDSITGYLFYAANAAQTGSLAMPFRLECSFAFMPTGWLVLWTGFLLPLAGTDYFLRFIQVPAILLVLLALWCASRRAGASATAASLVCAVAAAQNHLRLRELFAHGRTDLWTLFALLAALTLILIAAKEGGRRRWCAAGLATGVALGMKPDAIVYIAGLIVFAFALPSHSPKSWGAYLVTMILVGGQGYLRNIWSTGNPFFPVPLTLMGVTVLPGDPSMVGTAILPVSLFSPITHLGIFLDGYDFFQPSTLFFAGGWFLALLNSLRAPRTRQRLMIPFLPLLLYGFYLAHPCAMPRRLFFPLMTAGVATALALDALHVPRLGDVLFGRLSRFIGLPAPSVFPRGVLPVLTGLLLLAGILSSPLCIGRYREQHASRLAAIAGPRDFDFGYDAVAPLWAAANAITSERPDTIALIDMNICYPFQGSRLANRVLYLPRHGESGRSSWNWGERVVNPFVPVEQSGFDKRLADAEVGLVAVDRRAPENEWLLALGAVPVAMARDGFLYRLPVCAREGAPQP